MTCKHEEIEKSKFIRDEHGVVEYTETCKDCGKKWVVTYGFREELDDEE